MGETVNGIDPQVMEPGPDLAERGYPGFNPRQVTADGLTIDDDVAVKLRDGVTIYAHGPIRRHRDGADFGPPRRGCPEQPAERSQPAPSNAISPGRSHAAATGSSKS